MNLKNKKTIYLIFAILLGILTAVGISYALWFITRSQTGHNLVGTACLEIELTNESADITLANQYPVTDETGMQSTPYTFTVTNNCSTSIDYRLALESLGDESTSLKATSLKIGLNDNIFLLSSKPSTTTTIDNAYNSRILETGTLEAKGSEGSSITYNLRIWIDQDAPNSEQNKTFDSKITVTVGQSIKNSIKEGTLAYDILSNYGGEGSIVELSTSEFSKTTDMANGLFKMPDNDGDSYYFRGDVEDNYVQFGTWDKGYIRYFSDGPSPEYYNTLEECEAGYNHNNFDTDCIRQGIEAGTPMYWRIVRINGDGTLRLIYDGITKNKNGIIHDTSIVKSDSYYSNIMEFGFIEYKDAETKTVVDNWYNDQLNSKYNSYLADSLYCNDTTEDRRNYIDVNGNSIDDAENAWDVEIYYSGNYRIHNKQPKLTCTQDKDKYTTKKENGNGLLTYPVGIITADEVLLAGLGTNSYFYNGDNYFTMTPNDKFDYYNIKGTFYCTGATLSSSINSPVEPITHRPVINLKVDVKFTGDGSYETPYVIVTN